MVSAVCSGVKRVARLSVYIGVLAWATPEPLAASTLTLAWDTNPDPTVAGYRVYFGVVSRTYTNIVPVANTNAVTITGLVPQVTYYFAATAFTTTGLESPYSAEASYTVPGLNVPPTLDPISSRTIDENAGPQTVNLTGISSGATNEGQTLTIVATSGNPVLLPNPDVHYTNPATTGSLSFTPLPNAYGTANVTVMVDDGGAVSNTIIRSFTVTVNQVNNPPTLDPIADVTVDENAGTQSVPLTGIATGASNEVQTLSISATSSNPGLIPDPPVNYSSPAASGSLSFTPAAYASGSAHILVVVNDGQSTNNTVVRAFTITVNQTVPQLVITNATILPLVQCKFAIPAINGDRLSYTLRPDAPAGAKLNANTGVFSWRPSAVQASTTNTFSVLITDNDNPALTTLGTVTLAVEDYLNASVGLANVLAGQSVTVPIYLSSSDGVTNLAFTLPWPTNRFSSPSLSVAVSGVASSSAQIQNTNLVIRLQTSPGKVILNSNLLAQLTFQTSSNQHSAFVALPPFNLTAIKPGAVAYANSILCPGEVAVVSTEPLLRGTVAGSRNMTIFARPGASYQLQSAPTSLPNATWSPITTLSQTNLTQIVPLGASSGLVFYRLLKM